jgi:hypothetical protein
MSFLTAHKAKNSLMILAPIEQPRDSWQLTYIHSVEPDIGLGEVQQDSLIIIPIPNTPPAEEFYLCDVDADVARRVREFSDAAFDKYASPPPPLRPPPPRVAPGAGRASLSYRSLRVVAPTRPLTDDPDSCPLLGPHRDLRLNDLAWRELVRRYSSGFAFVVARLPPGSPECGFSVTYRCEDAFLPTAHAATSERTQRGLAQMDVTVLAFNAVLGSKTGMCPRALEYHPGARARLAKSAEEYNPRYVADDSHVRGLPSRWPAAAEVLRCLPVLARNSKGDRLSVLRHSRPTTLCRVRYLPTAAQEYYNRDLWGRRAEQNDEVVIKEALTQLDYWLLVRSERLNPCDASFTPVEPTLANFGPTMDFVMCLVGRRLASPSFDVDAVVDGYCSKNGTFSPEAMFLNLDVAAAQGFEPNPGDGKVLWLCQEAFNGMNKPVDRRLKHNLFFRLANTPAGGRLLQTLERMVGANGWEQLPPLPPLGRPVALAPNQTGPACLEYWSKERCNNPSTWISGCTISGTNCCHYAPLGRADVKYPQVLPVCPGIYASGCCTTPNCTLVHTHNITFLQQALPPPPARNNRNRDNRQQQMDPRAQRGNRDQGRGNRDQGRGNRDQGGGNRDQGRGNRDQGRNQPRRGRGGRGGNGQGNGQGYGQGNGQAWN